MAASSRQWVWDQARDQRHALRKTRLSSLAEIQPVQFPATAASIWLEYLLINSASDESELVYSSVTTPLI
jgi:phage head maturation protease